MKVEIVEKAGTERVELLIDDEILVYWTKEFEFEYQSPIVDPQVYRLNFQMELIHPLFKIIKESKYSAGVKAEALVVLLERFDNKAYPEEDKKKAIEIITKDLETPV